MFFDLFEHAGVLDQFTSGHLGDDLAGQIVLGRTDAAAGDNDISAFHGAPDDLFHPCRIVAHHRFEIEVHAQRREPLRHPRRVGIDDLTEQ